jgi:hypothetical protein
MPLRRESEMCDPENLVGVTFAMVDEALGKRVICRVTYQALCDRAAMDGDGHHWLRAWENHLGTIETLASANYDAGKALVNGVLLVDTLELTPLSQSKSYFQARR